MVEAVLVVFTARQETERLRVGQFGVQQQDFGGRRTGQRDNHIVARSGFMQADVESLVFFLVHQLIVA
ncbi:hypothetical protein D3C81_2160220 [compost metagenome]